MYAVTRYDQGKRYLHVLSGEGRSIWSADFRWQGVLSPAIFLRWLYHGRWLYPKPGDVVVPLFGAGCPAIRATIDPRGFVYVSYDSYDAGHTKSHLYSDRIGGDPEHIKNLLSLARSVAAKKAPPEAILGYIEDHLPEPYCALATDDPIRLFRSRCPIPLFGWSDCYATTGKPSEKGVSPEHDPGGPQDGDTAGADDGHGPA